MAPAHPLHFLPLGLRVAHLSLALGLLTACAPGADPGADGGPPPSCTTTCTRRLSECGPPPGGDPCAPVCASLTTASELACLASSSCEALAADFERGRIPCDGAGSTDAGIGLDGGGGGGCDPSDAPRCVGNAVVTCEVIAGAPREVSSTCSGGATCERGECVAPACDPLGTLGCSSGAGSCCAGTVCFSEIERTRCCVPADESQPCGEDADCCGHDPDSVFTARCFATGCRLSL